MKASISHIGFPLFLSLGSILVVKEWRRPQPVAVKRIGAYRGWILSLSLSLYILQQVQQWI